MGTSRDEVAGITRWLYEVGQLKRLPRAGWQLAGVPNPESVAEHSFRVAVVAFALAVEEGADPYRAATLGLFHDVPETRIGDVPSVGKPYVHTADAVHVTEDQTAGLPRSLARHVVELITEHETAKSPDATLEARCSRDADKLDCLLQAREYQAQTGNHQLKPWVTSMAEAVRTQTGRALAAVAQEVEPGEWWHDFAANFSNLSKPQR